MSPADAEEVAKGLRSNRMETFQSAARTAVSLDPDGDRLLAEATALPGWRGVYAAAALGESRGPVGEQALRALIAHRGPRTSDLRSAATLALAKRSGTAASDVLAEVLDDKDSSVRNYALICLAAVGDSRAWEAALVRLNSMLSRQPMREGEPSSTVMAVIYLARHAVDDEARLRRVVETLHKHWRRIGDEDRAWIETYWPGAHPGLDQQQPLLSRQSAEAMLQYILSDPLFSATALL